MIMPCDDGWRYDKTDLEQDAVAKILQKGREHTKMGGMRITAACRDHQLKWRRSDDLI